MVSLHRLNDDLFILNSNHIEKIEEKPDTIITLTNDNKYVVKESADEIIGKIIDFKKKLGIDLSTLVSKED